MPKRTAEEKLAHYQRKIRKIQEVVKKKRYIRPLDSSDDEINEETNRAESYVEMMDEPSEQPAHIPDDLQLTPPPPLPHLVSAQVSEQSEKSEDNQVANALLSEAQPEAPLDPELLSALGACSSDTPDFGERIHESLANLWLPLLRKGLTKEDKDNLRKEYLIPSNCTLLQAPKLNAEISAAISDIVRGRDKKLTGFQQQLGTGISAINRAMDMMLKTDNKVQALKALRDGCRLLSDLHHCFTKDRTSLEKNFLHVIQDSKRDETLFGNTLAEKIKACKAIERQSLQIRKPNNPKSVTFQPSTSRPVQQGNWTGPPRYPSNRGGGVRGGHRRQAPTAARRPFIPNSNQSHSKISNQPKSRANLQH